MISIILLLLLLILLLLTLITGSMYIKFKRNLDSEVDFEKLEQLLKQS